MKSLMKKMILKYRLKNLKVHGSHVWAGRNSLFQGNIEVGSHVSIGSGAHFVSTLAKIIIHDYVVFGPNVTIYTGDHPIDILGKHIYEITDAEKMGGGNYDKDVIIEAGCWIGTRAIILKGVTVGKGSVVGAGAIVTKDIPPYSVYVGVPSCKTMRRFTEEEAREHEKILKERQMVIQ